MHNYAVATLNAFLSYVIFSCYQSFLLCYFKECDKYVYRVSFYQCPGLDYYVYGKTQSWLSLSKLCNTWNKKGDGQH